MSDLKQIVKNRKKAKKKADPIMEEVRELSGVARERSNLKIDKLRHKELKRIRSVANRIDGFLHIPATGSGGYCTT